MGSSWLLLAGAVFWTVNSFGVGVWLGFRLARHRQPAPCIDGERVPPHRDDRGEHWSPISDELAEGVSKAGAAVRKAEWVSALCEETSTVPRTLVAAARDLTHAVRDLHLQIGSIFAAFDALRGRHQPAEPPLLSGYPCGQTAGVVDLPGRARRPPNGDSSMRFPYPCRQWVAPCIAGQLPASGDFFEVQCHDLDKDGITFYVQSMLPAETFVISLGSHDDLSFMLARVMSEHALPAGQPGKYLLECRFLQRLEQEANSWKADVGIEKVDQLTAATR